MTEAEALARVKPAPVESPDDWVEITDPEHVLRVNIDEIFRVTTAAWSPTATWSPVALRDKKLRDFNGHYTKARCRRKDLPVQFADELAAKTTAIRATKRLPVRLWTIAGACHDERYNVFAKISPPAQHELYREIHFDGTQFYIEETT